MRSLLVPRNVKILGRAFAPPVWAVLVYVVVCVAMLALGRWQLLRADEKISILTAAEAAASAPHVALDSVPASALPEAAQNYLRVDARGTWLPDTQLLWDNRAHASQAGVEVITPLQLPDGRVVLVNRGWTPLGGLRSETPDVTMTGRGLPGAALAEVRGSLSRPSQGFAKGDAIDDTAPWPRYLQYFDYEAIGVLLQADVMPVVLQADRSVDGPWFISNWQPAASGPEKHYAYAVQWFGMAAALTVIFIVVNLQRLTPATRTA